jgi:hypothetical protein
MATKKSKDAPDVTPAFVFRGTVRKIRSATMKEVPVGDRTAVVRVDQVLESPKTFARYEGQNITVELAGRGKVAAGDELIFHADSWMFGDSVALRSKAQERVTKTTAKVHAAFAAAAGDPVANKHATHLQQHVNDADLVVSGRVTGVTVPPEPAEHAMAAALSQQPVRPVSEHDPKWRQAVIQVDETHKGSHDSGQVTVLFPASTDVRWYRAPKFQAGQQGLFVLHKTTIKTDEHHALKALAAGTASPDVEVYTALHPEDVQPLTQQAAVKAMIG